MTWQELQKQALQLPISDLWHLVQSVFASIQQETTIQPLTNLDPWNQSLIGSIQLPTESLTETYVDYLEEKYSYY